MPLSPPLQGHPSHDAPRKPLEPVAQGDTCPCPQSVPRPPLPGGIWPWDQPRVKSGGKAAPGWIRSLWKSFPSSHLRSCCRGRFQCLSLSKGGNVWTNCGNFGVLRSSFPLGMFQDFVNKMMDARSGRGELRIPPIPRSWERLWPEFPPLLDTTHS